MCDKVIAASRSQLKSNRKRVGKRSERKKDRNKIHHRRPALFFIDKKVIKIYNFCVETKNFGASTFLKLFRDMIT